MTFLVIYLSGVVTVFLIFLVYNRWVDRQDIPYHEKVESKIPFDFAFFLSILSWGSVLGVLIIIFVGSIIYLATETKIAKKIDKWFLGERGDSENN